MTDMHIDILEGTNFHKENNVLAHIARNIISICDTCTSPTVLDMEKLNSPHRLSMMSQKVSVILGNSSIFLFMWTLVS